MKEVIIIIDTEMDRNLGTIQGKLLTISCIKLLLNKVSEHFRMCFIACVLHANSNTEMLKRLDMREFHFYFIHSIARMYFYLRRIGQM